MSNKIGNTVKFFQKKNTKKTGLSVKMKYFFIDFALIVFSIALELQKQSISETFFFVAHNDFFFCRSKMVS